MSGYIHLNQRRMLTAVIGALAAAAAVATLTISSVAPANETTRADGDGSVRSIANSINRPTWWAALTPSDGNPLGNDW